MSQAFPVSQNLNASGGQPLDRSTMHHMNTAFGQDFSSVRVHASGPGSAQALRTGSPAFTRGNEIFFAPGHYQPHTPQGQELIGHELTHVVQQRQGRVAPVANGIVEVSR